MKKPNYHLALQRACRNVARCQRNLRATNIDCENGDAGVPELRVAENELKLAEKWFCLVACRAIRNGHTLVPVEIHPAVATSRTIMEKFRAPSFVWPRGILVNQSA